MLSSIRRFGSEPTFAGFEKLGSLNCPHDRMAVECNLLLAQDQVHDPATNVRPFCSGIVLPCIGSAISRSERRVIQGKTPHLHTAELLARHLTRDSNRQTARTGLLT